MNNWLLHTAIPQQIIECSEDVQQNINVTSVL